jgi:hypothetical protein
MYTRKYTTCIAIYIAVFVIELRTTEHCRMDGVTGHHAGTLSSAPWRAAPRYKKIPCIIHIIIVHFMREVVDYLNGLCFKLLMRLVLTSKQL